MATTSRPLCGAEGGAAGSATFADCLPHRHRQAAFHACRASAAATARACIARTPRRRAQPLDWPHAPFEIPAGCWRLAGRRPTQRGRPRGLARGAPRCRRARARVRPRAARRAAGRLARGAARLQADGRARGPPRRHHDLGRDQRPPDDVLPERMVGCADLEAPDRPQAPPARLHRGRSRRRVRALWRARAPDGRDGQWHGGPWRHHCRWPSPTSPSRTTSARRCAWPR